VHASRVEAGVVEVKSQLDRHQDSLSLLSKQMKLLRHVPLEVASLRDDLLNIITQLPPGLTYNSTYCLYQIKHT